MDAGRTKKLQDFAVYLSKHAESVEKEGNIPEATKDYLKLVDVLLLLAREANDHPTWLAYTSKAEYYQKKVKSTLSLPSPTTAPPPPPLPSSARQHYSVATAEAKQESLKQDVTPMQGTPAGAVLSPKANPLKKIFGSFKKTEVQKPKKPTVTEYSKLDESSQHKITNLAAPEEIEAMETIERTEDHSEPPKQETVPMSVYRQLLSQHDSLKDKIKSMVEKSEYVVLEAKNKQLAENIADMVPRSEYETLKTRLSEYVPKVQYEELQKIVAGMVSKEVYLDAERRASKFEAKFENSVSRNVLDDLASDLIYLVAMAEIPLGEPPVASSSSSPATLLRNGAEEPTQIPESAGFQEVNASDKGTSPTRTKPESAN